jgi:selenocysteine lyase/cysteine desulfurase
MREHFHVPDTYFLTHSVGCLPKTTPEVLDTKYFKPWRETGGRAWDQWLDILDEFRTGIGMMLGVKKGNICPQTNVSSALTKILYSLPKREGRKTIVLSEQDFPTIGFVMERAKTAGFEIRYVRGDVTDVDNWAEAIDDHTALVHITHALSNTSHLLPVDEICELTRRAKAVSVVDVAQSIGVLQIKTNTWDPDFITGTCVKFVCGGPGACFMYASDDMLAMCAPLDVGWFSHENPFEMQIENFRFAPDAMKFIGGTPSPAPYACAANAISVWRECGIFEAQFRVQNILDQLAAVVPPGQLVSPTDPELRGGTLVIKPDNASRFTSSLDAAGIIYDGRTDGYRFSVQGYTSEHDVAVLQEVFKAAL